MKKIKLPSVIVGLFYVPFGFLLAWVAGSGIIGLILNCGLAFLFAWLLTTLIHKIFRGALLKNHTEAELASVILVKSAVYLIPFIILAFAARMLLGWGTMMPFIATATMAYMAAATMEIGKTGVKGIFVTMIPSILGSTVTMIWTMLFSILF